MKINLRKANIIQHELFRSIKAIDLISLSTVRLNVYEEPLVQMQNASDLFRDKSSLKFEMIKALYEIRQLVSVQNHQAGVNEYLSQIASIEMQMKDLQNIIDAGCIKSWDYINGKLEASKNTDKSLMSAGRDVISTVFPVAIIEAFTDQLCEMKGEKQAYKDALLEINIRTEIEISEKNRKSLTRFKSFITGRQFGSPEKRRGSTSVPS